jgi:hypothetical protein
LTAGRSLAHRVARELTHCERLRPLVSGVCCRLQIRDRIRRPKLTYSLTRWVLCTAPCPVDDAGTRRLVIKPSSAPGSNGVVFKLKLAGLKKNGVPAQVPSVRLYFFNVRRTA